VLSESLQTKVQGKFDEWVRIMNCVLIGTMTLADDYTIAVLIPENR
jgi:hypothetical protein